MEKSFRTLRGFLAKKRPEEDNYFHYPATLRISGGIPDMKKISTRLGLQPTYSHRKAGKPNPGAAPHRQDMWLYTAPLDEREPLRRQIDALWLELKPHKRYLLRLKKSLKH